MKIQCKIFHESKKNAAAEKCISNFVTHNKSDLRISRTEPYLDKGCVTFCEEMIDAKTWPDFVFEVISNAQKICRRIELRGDIAEEIDILSSEAIAGPGIRMVLWHVSRKDFEEARIA